MLGLFRIDIHGEERKMAARKNTINGLTPTQVKALHKALLEKQEELRRSVTQRRSRDSAIDPSEIIEELEQAATGQHQDVSLRILDKEVKLLREIERALKKFDKEEFGLCEGTLEPIGLARLKARPWARYSVTHKEELERQQREQSTLRPGR
jgi:DnaK suppressor protein